MEGILDRDRTGFCTEGDCRDRAFEGELDRQAQINASGFESEEEFPNVSGAWSRNEAPGFLGGHV